MTVPLPIYNRNQGGISRAKINVTQSELQLADLERQAMIDVEEAVQEYEMSRRPGGGAAGPCHPRRHASARRRLQTRGKEGRHSLLDYLQAQLDYNDVVKQYLDTAVRHRRSMLSLNTTVGRRIMP